MNDVASPQICPLDGYGLLRVEGADAREFLNAQFCSDINEITPLKSGLSGYCNPKGRLLACLRVFRVGDIHYLRMPKSLVADIAKRLSMFVMRAQVTVHPCDADDIAPRIGVLGPMERPGDFGLSEPPGEVNACAPLADGGVAIRVAAHDETPRWELYGKPSPADGADGDFALWRLHDILAGLPTVYPETGALFVPQMANMDLVGALSYTKGCYPGQEVISRTRYRGTIKRRMVGFTSSHLPQPGAPVYAPGFSVEQASGEVADACRNNEGQAVGLAVVRLQGLDKAPLHFDSPDGPTASIRALPYVVDERPADEAAQ